ncbi:hypothetical protein LINPERHAP1_LOCUS30138 [Linum perenne]
MTSPQDDRGEDLWVLGAEDTENGVMFGIICWLLWKTRNERVFFEVRTLPTVVVAQSLSWSASVGEAWSKTGSMLSEGASKFVTNMAWDPGPYGWITLNSDGSVEREMRGAIEGYKRAWEAGFHKVILKMDSMAAISLLSMRARHAINMEWRWQNFRSSDGETRIWSLSTPTVREIVRQIFSLVSVMAIILGVTRFLFEIVILLIT